MKDDYNAALKAADEYNQIFGKGNFYLEIMDHGILEQRQVNEGIMKISKELDIPMIVTNDVHYLEQCQSSAHDALLCIQTQNVIYTPHLGVFLFQTLYMAQVCEILA